MFRYSLKNRHFQIKQLVENYLQQNSAMHSTQQILDAGSVPALKGFQVKPGKVSDSIFGGKFSLKKNGQLIEVENPPLVTKTGKPLRIMVRTARISTHDIARGKIPLKDQVLALNHNIMRRLLTRAVGSSQIECGLADNAIVSAAENLKQIPFENVLRAYMAKSSTQTSLYQCYLSGQREFCGHTLPEKLIPNGPLPYLMDTPTTKSVEHDEPITVQQLFERKICTPSQYKQIRNNALFAFGIATEFLALRGLLVVDTKTEHGINQAGHIVSQDELYTLDSSRFWLANDYQQQWQQLQQGKIDVLNPKPYSKEFAREIVSENTSETYSESQCIEIAIRYIESIELISQTNFKPDLRHRDEQVITGLQNVVETLLYTPHD